MQLFRLKWLIRLFLIVGFIGVVTTWWVGWSNWPNPEAEELPWRPDAILVLGGGNEERPREALRLHAKFPDADLIITGDGGIIRQSLLKSGLPDAGILHEVSATSTVENAQFTRAILDRSAAKRIVLVTNWFHAPRSLAVFERYQPEREFAVAFEPKPERMNNWHRYASRRERLAALLYIVRYQVWSF